MFLFLAVVLLGFAGFLVAEVATAPQQRRRLALRRASLYGKARTQVVHDLPRFRERVLTPLVKRLAALALRINPRISDEAIGTRLIAAGIAAKISVPQFLALKAALGIGGLAGGLVVGFAAGGAGLLLVPIGAAGFFLPDFLVGSRVRVRRERIRAELPDALDLLAVSVEAGLGLDGAITKLSEHMEGALVDEFALTLGEIRIGEARQDALRKLAERVPAPEVSAFVRSVLQADQLGISLGRILRVQAADSRLRRQAAAEEKAMKAPIKMLFPTAILIFPALFVVILGPALLNVSHYLK
jgi:tight adherence protein C